MPSLKRLLLSSSIAFLVGCSSSPRPGPTPLERAREVYPQVRATLTLGEVVAVDRGLISKVDGDRILATLAAIQAALDAGHTQGDWSAVISLGDTVVDALGQAGELRPSEVDAVKAMLRSLLAALA